MVGKGPCVEGVNAEGFYFTDALSKRRYSSGMGHRAQRARHKVKIRVEDVRSGGGQL